MNEPHEPQHEQDFGKPADEKLTTAALADTGAPNAPVETRTFAQADGGGDSAADSAAPLFPNEEAEDLRHAWDKIQTSFVDEPRRAVEEADHLVASAMKRLAEIYSDERARLEGQWGRGDDVNTEDLRLALRRYRAFFGRLLSA